jgi:hypothetical protein
MAKITIVELQAVASGENFADSAMDLSINELKVMRGGDGHGYGGKEKDDDDKEKKKYSYYPCNPCYPCHY